MQGNARLQSIQHQHHSMHHTPAKAPPRLGRSLVTNYGDPGKLPAYGAAGLKEPQGLRNIKYQTNKYALGSETKNRDHRVNSGGDDGTYLPEIKLSQSTVAKQRKAKNKQSEFNE